MRLRSLDVPEPVAVYVRSRIWAAAATLRVGSRAQCVPLSRGEDGGIWRRSRSGSHLRSR